MFESKYSRFITNNTARFAEENEITDGLVTIKKGAGVPLYESSGTIFTDNGDTHSIVVGPTGCGKSRAVCKTLITSIIRQGESYLVNDPKGELYKSTVALAKETGYDVKVLNLRNPQFSHRWNPLALIYFYYTHDKAEKAQQAIDEFSIGLMSATADKDDRYWDMTASIYFCAVISMCLYFVTDMEYFNLENILPFINEDAEDTIRRMMSFMEDAPESIQSGLKSVLNINADKTKSCIYGVLHSGVDSIAKNESLLQLFSENEIDLRRIGLKKTAVYVIYPDEKCSMDGIVNLFFNQAYMALLDVCEEMTRDSLPIRVNYVLDEFSNLVANQGFTNRLTEARSKNIRYFLFVQSITQLSEKYTHDVSKTIMSNCTNWISFSSKEIDYLEMLSKLCGSVIDYNGREHPLISPSEMQYLKKTPDGVEVLILRQGVRPYVVTLPYFDMIKGFQKYNRANSLNIEFQERTAKNEYKLDLSDWRKMALNQMQQKSTHEIVSDHPMQDESSEDDEIKAEIEAKFIELFGDVDDD